MPTITINPELQSLIPRLTAEEYAQLEANILQDGCHDALIVWQEENTLLDGHNRYEICERHNIELGGIIELSLPDLDAAKLWMIANQLGRRNLTRDQMSYFRGKQYELHKHSGFKGNQHTCASGKSYQKHDTAQALAEKHHVAEKTIRNDATYAKAIDTIADVVGPEARQAILARDTKVTQQEVKALAKIATTRALSAKSALEAINGAKTPKQARQIVRGVTRETREYAAHMDALARSEGLSGAPAPPTVQQRAWEQVFHDELARRLTKATQSLDMLWRHLSGDAGWLAVHLPAVLEQQTEACITLGRSWRSVERLLTKSEAVLNALSGRPEAVSVNGSAAVARQSTTIPRRQYGSLIERVEQQAQTRGQFSCDEVAKQLGATNKAVWQALQALVKKQKLCREGETYTYAEEGALVGE